jgi:hypothetical protein
MCYCGEFATDGFFNCCQDLMTKKQEEKIKREWAKQVDKSHFDQKNKDASAYMPRVEEVVKAALNTVPPNETPREELLQRDVAILLTETQILRKTNEDLMAANEVLFKQNKNLFESFIKICKENKERILKERAEHADL